MTTLRTAAQQPLYDWVFKRNADGSIGIFAPPPKPGESQRTSDCVGTNQRDLNELLGKLADHMTALAEPQEPVGDAAIHAARTAGFVEGEKAALAQPVQEPVAYKSDTVCALCAREIALEAETAPFGCVTVRRLSLRHENHADQYQFYPAGQSPYLDNVDECHTVYTAPPKRKENT